MRRADAARPPTLGLRANAGQFTLLVGINALVGAMVGQERTIIPLIAERIFGLTNLTTAMTFLIAFGVVKAATNLVAGSLSDRIGRRPVLLAGWLIGLPIAPLLMWAPAWGWIVFANVLLGINQGLTWSTTVIMKIDLAGPKRRGLAMGLNEGAGYAAVAVAAGVTGFIASRAGLRPEPFFFGLAVAGAGLGLSAAFVRETLPHAHLEATETHRPPLRSVFRRATITDPTLSSCSQAGLVNNLNDGMAWGLLPIWFARGGLSIAAVGTLAALYPAVWGVGQLATGAWSDRIGRKPLIVGGMLLQAGAIAMIASVHTFAWWAVAAVLLGAGTAMVYPTLLAAIGDVAPPQWRASAIGVYRLWRDLGFAVGAILTGVVADRFGIPAAIWVVAAITAASGGLVAVRMQETLSRAGPAPSDRPA